MNNPALGVYGNLPSWLEELRDSFPSTYGRHSLDLNNRVLKTRFPGDDYPARHRHEPLQWWLRDGRMLRFNRVKECYDDRRIDRG